MFKMVVNTQNIEIKHLSYALVIMLVMYYVMHFCIYKVVLEKLCLFYILSFLNPFSSLTINTTFTLTFEKTHLAN